MELDVRHGQGARYQHNTPPSNVVVTAAAAKGMEVPIGLSREGRAVHLYTMGHWDGQPEGQWKSEPTLGEPLHAVVLRRPGRAESEDTVELNRAEREKEKHQRKAAAESLDILGNRRGRKDMLLKWPRG